MRIGHYDLKTLPLAGEELVRICFWGNGKDSEARIEVKGAREATIPLSGAAMDLTFAGPITMSTRRSYSDRDTTCLEQLSCRNASRQIPQRYRQNSC
jgi:hypothetical protein